MGNNSTRSTPPAGHAAGATRRPPSGIVPPAARAPSGAPATTATPRTARRPRYRADAKLSPLAVVGVVWASMCFLSLLLSALRGAGPPLPEVRPPAWHAVLDYVVAPLGWTAPLATTVLGFLAIADIRKSDGAKYGLSLALFDAMFFPLLLLDFGVVWLCRQGAAALIQQDVMSPAVADALLGQVVPILVIILGDYYLATRAWAAVKSEPA